MNNETIPLIKLFGQKFNIPQYQRGYRWGEEEVTELLDDLWNFHNTSAALEFYCLQPIVLQKEEDGSYNVLDGQQRLTTLYLILMYLEEPILENGYKDKIFSLNYETRKDCEDFLMNKEFKKSDSDKANSNIDFFHIVEAYQCIAKWFEEEKHRGAKIKLIPILMDDNGPGKRNVRFIQYEIEEGVNPIEVFIRLNVGKIALTDAELIKALLLQSDKYKPEELKYKKMRLFEIAAEWDKIEYALQNQDFWYFINNDDNNKPNHIEFIFRLVAGRIQKEKEYISEWKSKNPLFQVLQRYLQDNISQDGEDRLEIVEMIWKQVVAYFEHFKAWYSDRVLFHYVGFLISVKGTSIIDKLIEESQEYSKSYFVELLKKRIGTEIEIKKERKDINGNKVKLQLETLQYEYDDQSTNDKIEINKILLLHNVYTTMKSDKEKAYFPFYLYKKTKKNEKWSLEHIHAQNSEVIKILEGRKQWLNDHIKSLNSLNTDEALLLVPKMEELLSFNEIEDKIFSAIVEEVYNLIDKGSGMTENEKHLISNLCLVDSHTNSKLNNSVFDVKRSIIRAIERKGGYVPICTRNVFLKVYSDYSPNNAYWASNDREQYLEDIKEMYQYFVNQ